jgi:hypothetical protein
MFAPVYGTGAGTDDLPVPFTKNSPRNTNGPEIAAYVADGLFGVRASMM